ncbi:5-hydroxytryptamine receptor 3C-like [Alosa pseudoharengus]|uniref:5-hydroxytryptamine receptor 3C-like n=1 Tax=Alosa pseudoharengus TaxID=34774 RepID=UPI003F88C676
MAAFHLHSKEDKKQWTTISIKVVVYGLVIQALFLESGVTLNCSEPTTESLLVSFNTSIFNMSPVRPVNNLNTLTNVSISFILYGILGVDEKAQMLKTLIWFDMKWKMEFLSWDPVECGTSFITLPRSKFWVPDIVIDEFVDENNAPETYYVTVSHTGEVQDALPVEVISSCNLDIFKFPFDIQNCSYTFNSWIHHADEIQLSYEKQVEEMVNLSKAVMATEGEWEFLGMTAYKHTLANFDESTRDQITYFIALRRQPTMYVVNLIIPSCFLITLDLFSFILPPQSVDRSAFKMTLILGYTVFLLLMNELLPVTGNTIPLINVFFSLCLALMVGSLLETILITNMLCGSIRDLPMPNWIRVLFLKYLARLVCMGKSKRAENQTAGRGGNPFAPYEGEKQEGTGEAKEPQTTDASLLELKRLRDDLRAIQRQLEIPDTANQTEEDWFYIGLVIDRIVFCIYFIFFFCSFIGILVIWISFYSVDQVEGH